MQQIQLPTLRPISKVRKPKILLLSDDLMMPSGIATMSREFVAGLVEHYDWIQLAAAQNHPDHGKIKDISQAIAEETGVKDASVKLYCHTGYGNPNVVRELIMIEKPDAILHFTDPRFWDWLYFMEHELRSTLKVPILYYNIWDSPPAPHWNKKFYSSCDLIMNISKQTNILVKTVLGDGAWKDILTGEGEGPIKVGYVPHGIDPKKFYPLDEVDPEYVKFKEEFSKKHPNAEFVIVWNNRNIRRKQASDLLLAYKAFCDGLTKAQAKKVLLVMHTDPLDPNGTDLYSVRDNVCPEYEVAFSVGAVATQVINYFYNIASVVINIASNEGFGLSGAEAMMAGTMIINNVTGGLQDQCNFMNEDGTPFELTAEIPSNHDKTCTKHGDWAVPVYPSNRSLQGSLATPYIFDDRCDFRDVAKAIEEVYQTSEKKRNEKGLKGRKWALENMSKARMCSLMHTCIQDVLTNWKAKPKFELIKVDTKAKKAKQTGIII